MSGISQASQVAVVKPIDGIFHTSQPDVIRLDRRIGIGAEGEVYEIRGRIDLVAKIYHEPPPPEKAEKLVVLSRLGSERLFNLSAWPVDVLRDTPGGSVVGFVMNRISGAEEVHALHSPKSRLQKFPEASWAFLIYVAANVARAVAAIHDHGFIIGDLNPKNILVTRRATVRLLDVDSFQITVDGKTYRCDGGFPEYTPPELQGVAFRDVDRTQEHDCFGLAVVIFQLLFMGRHPFSGNYLGAGEMPLERAIREFRFAYGVDAEVRKMRQPPGTLALDSMPSWLVGLFRRAFLSPDRPKSGEWIEPLDMLAKALNKCALHSGHYYYRELRACPWCGIESNARVRLFNFMLPGAGSQRGYFRLEEIWKEIVAVRRPENPLAHRDQLPPAVEPSSEAEDIARDRRHSLILSIWCAALSGLLISLFINFPLALPLLFGAGLVACILGKVRLNTTMQLLFRGWQPVSDDPSVVAIQERRRKAEEVAQRLQQQFNSEAGFERWSVRRDELRNLKETYENLPQIREFKLKQLARKDQFDEFLDGYEITHPDIAGIGANSIVELRSHGLETAADITEERLGQIPGLNESRAKRLLNWREELERKFVFDPGKLVNSQPRIAAEKEVDLLRLHLEQELSGGAHYLRRIKQEIETDIEKLQPVLMRARRELAQAEKDVELAGKRNSFVPILAVLIIAFFIGSQVGPSPQPSHKTPIGIPPSKSGGPPPPVAPPPPPPPPAIQNESRVAVNQEQTRAASNHYRQGVRLSGEKRFSEAVTEFRNAIEIDPKFTGAHEELAFALYSLNLYGESVEASRTAIRIYADFGPYYNLGLAYIALNNWGDAKTAFENAILHPNKTRSPEKHVQAYYFLGLSKTQLGEAGQQIERLENVLNSSPQLTVERVELACLYLWVGRQEDARKQHEILLTSDPSLANGLLNLMKKHETRPAPGKVKAVTASVVSA